MIKKSFDRKPFAAFLIVLLLTACGHAQAETNTVSDQISLAKLNEAAALMRDGKFEGRRLDVEQIETFLSGANYVGITRDGQRIGFSLTEEGEEKKKLFARFYDESWMINQRSEGVWWTEAPDIICGSLKIYRQSKPKSGCFKVIWVDKNFVLESLEGEQVFWSVLDSFYDPSKRVQTLFLKSGDAPDRSDAWTYGYLARYSEICNWYHLTGIEEQILSLLKNIYSDDPDYEKGYAVLGEPEKPGAVVDPDKCGAVKAVIERMDKAFKSVNQ